MQWEFTPEEVVKGEVGYGLHEFRRDLFEVAKAGFLKCKDRISVPACFFLHFRQSADQYFFCFRAASASRAFTEPSAFRVLTAFFDLPDPVFLTKPRHSVALL